MGERVRDDRVEEEGGVDGVGEGRIDNKLEERGEGNEVG